jgi:hypothetical protein
MMWTRYGWPSYAGYPLLRGTTQLVIVRVSSVHARVQQAECRQQQHANSSRTVAQGHWRCFTITSTSCVPCMSSLSIGNEALIGPPPFSLLPVADQHIQGWGLFTHLPHLT